MSRLKKRVFYITTISDVWTDVARNLQEYLGWEPVLWTGVRTQDSRYLSNESAVKAAFPNCRFYHNLDIGLLRNDAQDIGRKWVDHQELGLKDLELMEALLMLSRQDPDGRTLTTADRFRFYQSQVAIWNQLFDELKPDLIFHPEIPHTTSDLVSLHVARMRGVPVLLTYFTKWRRGALFTKGIHDKNNHLTRERVLQTPIDPEVQKYAQVLAGTYITPAVEVEFFERSRKSNPLNWTWKMGVLGLKHLLRGRLFRVPYADYLGRDTHLDRDRAGSTELREHWRKYRNGLISMGHRRTYDALSKPADLTKKFVYFAANYQPERTTGPDAGIYVDLLYLLRMARSVLPEEVHIYFKEHPRTFDPVGKGPWSRDEVFYREVVSLKNVQIVPVETSSYDLIDRSMFSMTATGSVGFEAPMRGKCSVIWGTPWYYGVDGALRARSRGEFASAVQEIMNGRKPDLDYNLRFFSAMRGAEGEVWSVWNQFKGRALKQSNPGEYDRIIRDTSDRLVDYARSFPDYARLFSGN